MSPRSKRIVVLALGILAFLCAPGAARAADGRAAGPAAQATSLKPPFCDPAWKVSPEEAFARQKREPGLALVDARSPAEHARLRIPGSLGVPLAFIKAKGFLRDRPLILVGDGFRNAALIAECRDLRKSGCDVAILEGGLPAWDLKGFPLEGDRFALAALRRISPQIVNQEQHKAAVTLLDFSRELRPESKSAFPSLMHLPAGFSPPGSVGNLRAAVGKAGCLTPILVATEDGDGYDRIARQLTAAGINAFYLEGGLSGYRRHLKDLAFSWQPREGRVRSLSPCRPCGENTVPNENP